MRTKARGATLVELDGTSQTHALSDLCTIGRDPTSLVVLRDHTVSRHHAEVIRTSHGRYLVRDLCTRGGTFVGGVRVVERFLIDGDEIRVGRVRLRFQEPASRAPIRHRPLTASGAPPL